MRILEIAFTLSPGGAERFVVDLSNELAKTNDVTLLTLRDDTVNPAVRNFYKYDLQPQLKYDCLGLKDGLSLYQWWKIWKYIHDNKPDVVHYHGGGMPWWIMVPMLLSSSKTVFAQTIHSDIHNGYDKGIYSWLVSLAGNRHKVRFAALSQTNYEELKRVYPKVMGACIVNGRASMKPTSEFNAVKVEVDSYRRNPDTKIFLHVARCNEVKNQKRLIKAFNRMAISCNTELLIIGGAFDEPLGKELQAMANEHVHFLGAKKNIPDYQLCADAFCLSSDFEGMPITLLEALLSGTPACSTPVCGAVDAIHDGENGVLAKDFTDEAYLAALQRMYDNLQLYHVNAQKQKDNSPYTIKICAEKYVNFFNLK